MDGLITCLLFFDIQELLFLANKILVLLLVSTFYLVIFLICKCFIINEDFGKVVGIGKNKIQLLFWMGLLHHSCFMIAFLVWRYALSCCHVDPFHLCSWLNMHTLFQVFCGSDISLVISFAQSSDSHGGTGWLLFVLIVLFFLPSDCFCWRYHPLRQISNAAWRPDILTVFLWFLSVQACAG